MSEDLSKHYDAQAVEPRIYARWLEARAFQAIPDQRAERFVVMMPLPNVTGALHMGHAMDNVMQDLLTRWHRMCGHNTLWMPGTDHAGIATQAVVERRLFEVEGKTRNDIGREALVERIWQWKDQYQKRIVEQQREMGCSCDWDRQRFTMDAVCARAVRYTFFRMFRDGLLYRGHRLVNWDCHLQTAVADDEILHETVSGYFWHLRYPVIDPQPGEPDYVVVATTRPETMLGDTAVACHPEPRLELERRIREVRERLEASRSRDRESIEGELAALVSRVETHLPTLERLAAMARAGRRVRLPLQDREIPLIADVWAKPELGSGCVKITPAHDPNDYEVWTRHRSVIDRINILNQDGTLNENAGAYAGLDRFEARGRVVADLERLGLVDRIEEREIEIGHSDRSKTPVEPYLSTQWFLRMGDQPNGVVCGRGTAKQFTTPGLAQAAIDAVAGEWRSPTGLKLTFHPDPVRYANTYSSWLGEKRDWCVSRQLWWGHQIPVWRASFSSESLTPALEKLKPTLDRDDVCVRAVPEGEDGWIVRSDSLSNRASERSIELQVCLLDAPVDAELEPLLESVGLVRDPDVLDTWFSSGLWPHSTLGWPDPATAKIDPGQLPLGGDADRPSALDYYYPGSCLVTGRDIITLWVARMVLMGLYNLGDLPFTDCFIHATILDGKGERMSKSKGNGIDPADIIERYGADAMRYVICELQTGMQDVRLPVQVISPFTGETLDLASLAHGSSRFTYLCPGSGKEFDVIGMASDLPAAKLFSDRFDVGRTFCTKLWNAARFAFLNLGERLPFRPMQPAELAPEDRWILSRLARACGEVDQALRSYNPAAAITAARSFFWSEVCDWYLEWIKPRLRASEQEAQVARQVLAVVLDHVLRLLHPFVPFITEELWQQLASVAPRRGLDVALEAPELLLHAPWPRPAAAWTDSALESRIELVQELVRGIRSVRSKYDVPPRQLIAASVRAAEPAVAPLRSLEPLLIHLSGLSAFEISADAQPSPTSATAVVGEMEIYLDGVIDLEKERERLSRQRDRLRKTVEAARAKLGNAQFTGRAPAHVVDAERQRMAEAETELERVEGSLSRLG